jgi:predicted kinase
MAKVVLGIGIPGSGKTTVLKPLAEKYSYSYICPDEIWETMPEGMDDEVKNVAVWNESYERTARSLSEGKTVVFDATFSEGHRRREFIAFAKEHGASKVQGVYLDVPSEIASERNQLRERIVPDFAISGMNNALTEQPPAIEDGFDSIFSLNEFQELCRVERSVEDGRWVKEFRPRLR